MRPSCGAQRDRRPADASEDNAVNRSIRSALHGADAVIARVRTRLYGVTGSAHLISGDSALRICDEWERYVIAVVHESKRAEAARDFRHHWPALVGWRERVLKHEGRFRPSTVAAAYESLSLECL